MKKAPYTDDEHKQFCGVVNPTNNPVVVNPFIAGLRKH